MRKSESAVERACDLYRESEYELRVSKFLTPQEKILVRNALGGGEERCFFWGGFRGAERCAAIFLPEWMLASYEDRLKKAGAESPGEREARFAKFLVEEPEIRAEIPVSAVRITGSGFQTLTHRDFMGAVLALGIERNMIGDVLVLSEKEAVVFAMDGIEPFILSELKKIGRDGVRAQRADISPDYEAERNFEEMTIHVSSMRLDGVVNQLTGEGRAAAERIVRGLVERNYFTASDGATEVRPGDVISIRGYGKFIIGEPDGTTRSGRLRLSCRKYC